MCPTVVMAQQEMETKGSAQFSNLSGPTCHVPQGMYFGTVKLTTDLNRPNFPNMLNVAHSSTVL